jgi:amino acid adenylation domain-containing protein
MTTAELLSNLRSLDVKIWADNGQLYCNAPKGALTADLRAQISERKAEILAFLRDASAKARSVEPPMQPVPRDGELPLSFAQQRLWLLDQLEPGGSVYHMSSTFHLIGPLNPDALEQSLAEIVRRHEALRTTFTTVEDRPVQVIAAPPSSGMAGAKLLSLPVVDLRHLGEAERQAEALRRAGEEIHRPFNLAADLMLRAGLFRLGAEEHLLFLAMHHIASDGWSMGVLYRELSILYEAFANHRPSPLPELPIQYADFAQWQRNWLQGEVLEAQVGYWKRQLRDLSVLELPADRPRPALQTYRGSRQTARLAKGPADALKALSQRESASLFMTLLAAFQILLCRHTGQEDIVVGSPIANRNRTQIEGLIGFFINTLVLRTDLSGDCTFRELLGRVREVTLGAYAHQDLPFEKLLEELRPGRDLSRTPLFQIFFNMVNVGDLSLELSGLKAQPLSTANPASKFDLTLYVREHDEGLQFSLVYNADLFNQDRMAEMLAQYERLLSQIARNPDQTISSFSLLTPAAEKLLPNPAEPLGSDWAGAVHDRLSYRAERLPQQPAVIDPYDRWTYQELNARSNQLAHYLLESGIQREEIVALYGDRSASLVWAMLGILKAGAAFLILDPAYPEERLVDYLRDAEPRGFIRLEAAGSVPEELDKALQRTVRCRLTLPRLAALRPDDRLQSYSTADPEIAIGPDDLACLSFTSGSTGKPKGVLGRHGPLSHFLPWQVKTFRLGSQDRFSLLSGLSHDPLQRDIFTALWAGATIYIPDPDVIGAPGRLADWMARQRITFTHLTPAMSRILSETADPQCRLPALRRAFFVGDKLTWDDVAGLQRFAPRCACINSYGSTETQRAVSYHKIPPQTTDMPVNGTFPVGRGMPNVQLLILNKAQKLAGIGEAGEIYMRSPHLARGYLNDPPLTQARFLANPFIRQAGDRLYKTGDVGRYRPDGAVEVLGRSDRQIKIRGFRVELGEIETALSSHSEIRESAVLLREDAPGKKRIVGYAIPQSGRKPTAHELHAFLKKKLPDYMVPSAIVMLDAFQLTPNGKIDTRALPAPPDARAQLGVTFVRPRTPAEETLAEIWRTVLSLDRVGIHDNFFELGGHSLLAIRVMARIQDAFHTTLPLRALFERPTVEELALAITQKELEKKFDQADLTGMLTELESISEEEAKELLGTKVPPKE